MINKLPSLLLLLVFSTAANALGLGGIKVNSALNEPLNAKIELISANPTQIEDIRVKLASAAVFRRTGIDRPFLLSKLRFKSVAPEQGTPYILVTTRESVREPFLDFLVEVSWAEGSLIREFTVLLDPPSYQPPKAQAAAIAPKRTTKADNNPQPARQAATTYGPIRSSETLWVIAGKVQPDKDISRNQTMVALLKANPDAFQYGNINLLKKGALLTVPSAEEVASIGASEARVSVKQQMAEWRRLNSKPSKSQPEKPSDSTAAVTETPPSSDVASDPQVSSRQQPEAVAEPVPAAENMAEVPEESSKTEPPAPEGQRLRVVDADRNWQLSDKSELGYPAQESDKLREAIKDSEQELAAVQDISQDIVELRAALESKVLALKKALDEKDAQLESLRKQIEQVGLSASPVASGQMSSASSGMSALKPEPIQTGNVTTDTPVTEPRPLESYWKDEFWMILMGIIILILASMLLFGRRKRDNEGAFEAPDLFQMSSQQVMVGNKEISEPVAMIDELFESPLEKRKAAPRESASDSVSMFPEQGADIASILTEADIYLAYRRYTQAETLVEEAMGLNPESPELKAKLLEIYAFRRDKKAFSRYLDQVYASLMVQSPELWEKIVEMGHDLVPDHVAWGTGDAASASLASALEDEAEDPLLSDDPLDMDMDMNLDLNLDDLEAPDVTSDLSVFDDLEDESDDDDLSSIDIDLGDLEDPTKDK